MAVTITTAENSFSVDGVWYRKGALTFEEASEDRIVIRGYVYSASEVSCDGVSFSTLPELVTWLNQSVFNAGGGNGEGVAGVQSVTGNLVSGTSENPVVNIPRFDQILNVPSAFTPSEHTHVVSDITDLDIDQSPTPLTIVERTASGQGKFTPAIGSDEAVVKNQLDSSIAGVNTSLETKVDKIEGYGLTPEPFTTAEKDKLSTVEDPKFQGQFSSVIELETNGTGGEGNYAYVDGGVSVELYIWNNTNSTWDLVAGESTAETPASVLQKYEVNADRNPFTDARRDKLDSITAIFTSILKNAYDQAVLWITTNGQILIDHLTNTSNPHNVTAEQVGLGDIDSRLDGKADLVGGKVPQEQLPEPVASSSIISEVVATTTTQYIIATIPEDAPELLRFELYIPDTIAPSFISMRFNGINTGIYKHVLQNVNNTSYSISRNYSQNQLRVLASASGAVNGRYNIRIEGTISNVAGQIKISNGTGYLAGVSPSDAPDINNLFGSAHDQELTDGKITQLLFVAMNSTGTARISVGSVLKIYGIK